MSFFDELKRRNVFRVAIAYGIAAWLLIEVTTTTFPMLRLPEWTATFVTVLLMIGFPVALIFAWAFELTPEGIKKEKNIVRSESITHVTGRKLDFAIIGVLAITVVYFVAEKFFWADDLATESQVNVSIAVLPFAPLSSGEDDGYFADGLTEEILNVLAQLPELQVTARTSSFFFKGQNLPVPEIAARLDVAHIVEGSVRRDGERVRITAQLIRASDGFHLWSDSYDRTLDDVFAVQEDIAEKIAEALDVVLDDNARRVMRSAGIRDVEAFIAYQKGLEAFATAHQSDTSISESLAIANAYFDRALEAAPGLTIARVLKADRAGHIILEIAARIRDEEYPGEAQEALATLKEEYNLAWQLSPPGNQRDILDLERTLFTNDWSRLPAQIQKAMQPGGCPQFNWTGEVIAPFGWAEQMAKKNRETLACNPMDGLASAQLSFSLIWAGDPEAALQAVEEAENKGISHPWLADGRYWALLAAGRVNDPAVSDPLPKGSISMLLFPRQFLREALAGDPAVARQMAEKYWSRLDANNWSSLLVAAVVGDRKRANEFATRIDAYPGSAVVFGGTVSYCFCGAPFDLEATPNYKAHIEEAGFHWPPPKRIDYPAKTW
jgi:TolB-like protein